MSGFEKRKYKRLPIRLALSCCKIGSSAENVYTGYTLNVCPGGVYFETAADALKPGNLVEVELAIPPTAGLLELGGRISGLAKVLRTNEVCADSAQSCGNYGVALQFCQSPKLCT